MYIGHRHFCAAKLNPRLTLYIKSYIIDQVYRITLSDPHFDIFIAPLVTEPCEIIRSGCGRDPLSPSGPGETF